MFEEKEDVASKSSENGTTSEEATRIPADLSMEIQQIQRLAASDESIKDTAEYKDLMAKMGSYQAASEDEEEDDEEEDDDKADDDSTEDEEDVFGVTKKAKKAKSIVLNFEAPSEMIQLIESKFGVKDAPTFFNSVQTWREQAQKASEVKSEYDAIMNDIAAMPPEIKKAVSLWANGEDHMRAFEQSRLDWSASWDKQDTEGLVQHYLGEEYDELMDSLEDETIDKSEFDKQVAIMAKSTKRLFNEDKQALEKDRAEYASRKENEEKLFKSSALDSVSNLSKAYPNFTKGNLNKVRTTLVEGKLDDLFFKPDGSYKEEAAELVAYALYGKQMAERLMKQGERKGESKANLEMVDKSPKSVRKAKSVDVSGFTKEQEAATQHLMGGMKRKSIFD